jgi:hypothetical protein
VSDEDKRKECEFCNTLWQGTDLKDNFLKRSVRGKQNPTLIFGRLVTLKNEIISCSELVESVGRKRAVAKWIATISFVTPVLPQVPRCLSPDRVSRNFIFWISIKI